MKFAHRFVNFHGLIQGSVQVLHQHVWWGLGVLSQNADTADALEGVGGWGSEPKW